MGPPRERDGELETTEHPKSSPSASMGPPRERDGERKRKAIALSLHLCFNGAAARTRRRDGGRSQGRCRCNELQWGRRANATERRSCRSCQLPRPRRFNGAAARTRRRASGTVPRVRCRPAASMGPPRERDGENEADKLQKLTGMRLQWGRRANATERGLRDPCPRRNSTLQWGRRANATESGEPFVSAARARSASMGPPRERDGEPGWFLTLCQCSNSFNGAAARTRRRAPRRRSSKSRPSGFNGAAARTRRRADVMRAVSVSSTSFNGAAARTRRRAQVSLEHVDG